MLAHCLRSAAAIVVLSAAVLQTTSLGCLPGRFPVCEKNDDCKDSKGKICSDLRCVQCGADSDCPDGYCELKLGECKSLGGAGAAKPAGSAGEPPEASPVAPE